MSLKFCIAATIASLLTWSLSATQIELRSREFEAEQTDYNLKVGNLTLDLGYNLAVGFDDNTNRSSDSLSREDGVKLGNALLLGIDWPLSPHLHIASDLLVGYVWFPVGEGTDGIIVRGGDGLVTGGVDVDILLGDHGLLTLGNAISRELDTIRIDREDNTEDFSLWNNTTSLQYQHEFSQHINSAIRFSRIQTWAGESRFQFRDNIKYQTDLLFSWQVNTKLKLGPFIHLEDTNFEKADDLGIRHNDLSEYDFGLNLSYQLTKSTSTQFSIGYQVFDIDTTNTSKISGGDAAEDEENGVSLNLTLNSSLTDVLDQQFAISYRRNAGTATFINFSEDVLLTYSLTWRFAQNWSFIGQLTGLKSNESDVGESGETYTETVGLSYNISPKSSVSWGYKRADKFSNASVSEYDRNEFTIQLNYDF